jgi:hypothetical protein
MSKDIDQRKLPLWTLTAMVVGGLPLFGSRGSSRTSRLQIPRHPLAAEEPVQIALSSKEKAKRKRSSGTNQ